MAGRLKPALADAYLARKPVWYAELDLDLLREAAQGTRVHFRALPVFPAVRRDITFIAPRSLRAEELLTAAGAARSQMLESAELLYVYEPGGSDTRNITVRLTFRRDDRTLQDSEVEKEREKIAAAVSRQLGVKI